MREGPSDERRVFKSCHRHMQLPMMGKLSDVSDLEISPDEGGSF